jgi:hypothetical protein
MPENPTLLPPEDNNIQIAGTSAATIASSTALRGFTDHVLRELRRAWLRAWIAANEIQAMKIALDVGFIDPETAIAHLHEIGVLHLIEASS